MRLRQVVLAATDLAATRTAIEDELGLPHVWADPGVGYFGLRNALYAIGDTFLEVVSPISDAAPARRFLDRAGHDAGYMAMVQTTEPLEDLRARADALSIRVVFTAETEGVTGLHFHPADTGGTLLSVDRCDVEASWPWAGPAWEAAPDRGYRSVVSASLAVAEPSVVAARWADLLDTDAEEDEIVLDRSRLQFISSSDRRSGLVSVEIDGPQRAPVTIAGVEFTCG